MFKKLIQFTSEDFSEKNRYKFDLPEDEDLETYIEIFGSKVQIIVEVEK